MGVLSEIQVPVRMEAWLPEAHSPLWETQAHMLGSLQAMKQSLQSQMTGKLSSQQPTLITP